MRCREKPTRGEVNPLVVSLLVAWCREVSMGGPENRWGDIEASPFATKHVENGWRPRLWLAMIDESNEIFCFHLMFI